MRTAMQQQSLRKQIITHDQDLAYGSNFASWHNATLPFSAKAGLDQGSLMLWPGSVGDSQLPTRTPSITRHASTNIAKKYGTLVPRAVPSWPEPPEPMAKHDPLILEHHER